MKNIRAISLGMLINMLGGYALTLALLSWLILKLGVSDSILSLLVIPNIIAAFFHGRCVYLPMHATAVLLALWLVPQVSQDRYTSLPVIAAGTFSSLIVSEIIHALVAARKRVEKHLRESEARFRSVIRQSSDGIALIDEQGAVIEWNHALEQMTGLSAQQALNTPLWEIILRLTPPPKITPQYSQQLKTWTIKAAKTGHWPWAGQVVENEYVRTDGALRIFQVSGFPIQTAHGFTLNGIVRDVTEHRQAEKEIQARQQYLEGVLVATPDAIVTLDAAHRVVEWNPGAEKLFGYQAQEARGKNIDHLVTRPDVWEQATRLTQMTLDHKAVKATETVRYRQDGSPVNVIVRGAPIILEDELIGVVAAYVDISERVRAENALRESKERYRTLFEASTDAILVETLNGKTIDCNKTACEMYGYTRQEMSRLDVTDLVPKGTLQQIIDSIRTELAHGYARIRVQSKKKDGTVFPTEATLTLTTINGQQRAVVFVRDLTEHLRAEKAMLQSSRMETAARLAGGIAHDLNNLMVGVLGNAELLELELVHLGNKTRQREVQDMLATIAESAQQASKLAQQLLAYARGGKYQIKQVNLNDTIRDVLRLRAWECDLPPGVQIERRMEANLWPILADETQISQMLLNLLTNAIEAIDGNGHITIATHNLVVDDTFCLAHPDLEPGPHIYLSVQDTGCGISPEVLAKIFEPFFTTKFQGRGLGLAAAYGIVKNHGGDISAHSEQGHGAAFHIYLPAANHKTAHPAEQVARPARNQMHKSGSDIDLSKNLETR